MPAKSSKSTNRWGEDTPSAKQTQIQWDELTGEEIGTFVSAVLEMGDAVLFGVTRDGSAVRVILMSGDEKRSDYFGSANDLLGWVRRTTQHIRKHHS